MRILVWGLGYVGTVSAACLARLGHDVVGIEVDDTKMKAINDGSSAIKEPGLSELIAEGVEAGRLRAVRDGVDLVASADVSLVCVGTPSAADGSQNLSYVETVARQIGAGLREATGYHVVTIRSTVFPGTTRSVIGPLLQSVSGRSEGDGFGLVMNPEFLREASAIGDFWDPPYTVIGEMDARAGDVIESLYAEVEAPVWRVRLEEAETVKLVNNAFHALKIGFANEVGRLCDAIDVDSHAVMDLVCADTKLNISPAYLRPGFAFGGSCLPKDLRSIAFHARRNGVEAPVIESILPSNRLQVEAVRRRIGGLGVRRVGILGLSFKADTDDLRESPVIALIQSLWQDGMDVTIHDPNVVPAEMMGSNLEYLERQLPQIHTISRDRIEDVLETSDVVIVTQKRPEFVDALRRLDPGTKVLDLVRIGGPDVTDAIPGYQGLAW